MTHRLHLDSFAGCWTVQRTIDDRLRSVEGAFDGEARFLSDPAGLIYHETGKLQMPGQTPFKAERRYRWVSGGDNIEVLFDDGRPFHRIDLNATAPRAAHFCDPDQYDVAYDFSNWPNWRTTWDVAGPRKSYRLSTHYQPA